MKHKPKKIRKKSGRVYPNLTISKKALIENNLFINPHWSDWVDYRDGFRSPFDKTKIRPTNCWWHEPEEIIPFNNKIKKHEKIRKAMKTKKGL